MRALYDYVAAESDEISFKVNDIFIKLEDKDDQGWCKGMKDGVSLLRQFYILYYYFFNNK